MAPCEGSSSAFSSSETMASTDPDCTAAFRATAELPKPAKAGDESATTDAKMIAVRILVRLPGVVLAVVELTARICVQDQEVVLVARERVLRIGAVVAVVGADLGRMHRHAAERAGVHVHRREQLRRIEHLDRLGVVRGARRDVARRVAG